jgi:hypothetical protein
MSLFKLAGGHGSHKAILFLITAISLTQLCGFMIFYPALYAPNIHMPLQADINDTFHIQKEKYARLPVFNKVVWVVFDAMRADMIIGNTKNAPFTSGELVQKGKIQFYKAYAHPPTITFAHVKSLMTGRLPHMLDAFSNLVFDQSNSNESAPSNDTYTTEEQEKMTEMVGDSLLYRMKRASKRIVVYADLLWFYMFPKKYYFEGRSENLDTFYILNTDTVDTNITRHLPNEFKNQDFDMLLLHFMGLDHVGHVQGIQMLNSVQFQEKALQLDRVLSEIYANITDDTLLLLCSDHGMNNKAQHGSGAKSETESFFAFINKQYNTSTHQSYLNTHTVNQIDIVPTMAMLMGIEIPKNNLGRIIPGVIRGTNVSYAQALFENARQVFLHVIIPNDDFWRGPRTEYSEKALMKIAKKSIRSIIPLYYRAESLFLMGDNQCIPVLEQLLETTTKLFDKYTVVSKDYWGMGFGLTAIVISSIAMLLLYLNYETLSGMIFISLYNY